MMLTLTFDLLTIQDCSHSGGAWGRLVTERHNSTSSGVELLRSSRRKLTIVISSGHIHLDQSRSIL